MQSSPIQDHHHPHFFFFYPPPPPPPAPLISTRSLTLQTRNSNEPTPPPPNSYPPPPLPVPLSPHTCTLEDSRSSLWVSRTTTSSTNALLPYLPYLPPSLFYFPALRMPGRGPGVVSLLSGGRGGNRWGAEWRREVFPSMTDERGRLDSVKKTRPAAVC